MKQHALNSDTRTRSVRQDTRFGVVLLLLALALPLPATNQQKVLAVDHPVFATLVELSIEQGIAVPSHSGPWSIAELQAMHDRLNPQLLSSGSLQRYQETARLLAAESTGELRGALSVTGVFAGYWHANNAEFLTDNDW